MKKVKKGTAGYIRSEQKRKLLSTLAMFSLPIGLFIIGLVVTKTRLNWLTFAAILGCLPACKSMVGLIMILLQKPVSTEVLRQTTRSAGELVSGYELVFTTYEHNTPINAVVICGDQVVCYTPDTKTQLPQIEKHITRILAANGFTDAEVKVFRDVKLYCQRIEHIRKNQKKYKAGITFKPDERYPDMNREQTMLHILYAISL